MQELMGSQVMVPDGLPGWEEYKPPSPAGFPAQIVGGKGKGAKGSKPTAELWLLFDDGNRLPFYLADVLKWLVKL